MRQFFLFVNSIQNGLHVGGRGRRQTQPADARLNLLGVEIEVALYVDGDFFGGLMLGKYTVSAYCCKVMGPSTCRPALTGWRYDSASRRTLPFVRYWSL